MDSKRALDLSIAIPALVLVTPLLAVLALAILLTSGWPILLVQTRVGANERPITVLKFRTMRVGVPVVAKAHLPRTAATYTLIGPVLRRWSLDELPQLLNVIVGSMSLVGPRPALPSQADLLALRRSRGISEQKPGITGMAQIRGRESLTLATKVRLESHYLQHRSILLDLRIIIATLAALTSRRGAY